MTSSWFEAAFSFQSNHVVPVASRLSRKLDDTGGSPPLHFSEDPIHSIQRSRLALVKQECNKAQPEFYSDMIWFRKYFPTTY